MSHQRLLLSSLAVLGASALLNPVCAREFQKTATMKISIKLEGKTLTASLDDNSTTRDFLALLPLTLTLKDYNRTEKISDLPRKLSTKGAPSGSDPNVGDIAYYAPWGNLAIFYRDFDYSTGLIKLGKMESDVDVQKNAPPTKAIIELIKD
jgi:hypothetical protein